MSDLFEPIAVVGIAARLPGAADALEYWRNLVAARESLTDLSDEELLAAGVPPQRVADPAYVKRAGLVPGADRFDADFFGMTPREAEVCDPQLRLFLEMTHEAIEDAGYGPALLGGDVAVFGACAASRYGDLNVLSDPRYAANPDLGLSVLNNIDYLATLASYKLNLRGPSMSVLTACSSSLTAVHLACRSLQFGECDAAVAGASNVDIPYRVGYRWSPGDVRAADGVCRPLDAAATGTVFTSGAGAVLLKRLDGAIADGDHIWGVIRGIGINNDGSDKVSFSAPSVSGQAAAVVEAMAVAGFGPEDIGCVELHATGTALGDPIELHALAAAYRRLSRDPAPAGPIPVGSVKSNIGHTNPVAGLAGLLKLALCLEHGQIPATVNLTTTNPRLELERTPFVVNDALRPWPRSAARPRRAGLTSLGIGGTNVHLVLEEAPPRTPTPHLDRPRLVVWSGKDEAAREANRAALAEHFVGAGEVEFADATATLQRGRTAHPWRGAVVCSGAADAVRRLGEARDLRAAGPAAPDPPGVVFTFPGQGSQHVGMAAGLYGTLRTFTETVDECLDALGQRGSDLYDLWLDGAPDGPLQSTANAQPVLFAVEYALARQWIRWGVQPAALLGHSLGELVAATVAGVLEAGAAMRLVALRGRLMQRCPEGAMLAVAAPADRLAPILRAGPATIAVAAVNAADRTVLAGPTADVAATARLLSVAGVEHRPVRTSHAFHTAAMMPAVEDFAAGFRGVPLRPPRLPVYSAASAEALTPEQATDPLFWARQLTGPVRFAPAVDAVTADAGPLTLLEVGPGQALTALLRRHPAVRDGRCRVLASLPRAAPAGRDLAADEPHLLGALAELWLGGVPVDWSGLHHDEPMQRVSLPGYRFQRRRYWVEPATAAATVRVAEQAPAASGELPGRPSGEPPDAGPFTVTGWVETPRPTAPAAGAPSAPVVLALVPPGPSPAGRLVTALERDGHRVLRVRPGPETRADDEGFIARPDRLAADLPQVLRRSGGEPPSLLVHGWGSGVVEPGHGPAPELDRTVLALQELVQGPGRRTVHGRLPALLVLTGGAVDVSGGEPVVPARAALVAAARSFRLESPDVTVRVVDAGPSVPGDLLLAEMRCAAADPVVALRGTRRWTPLQRPWSVPAGGRPLLRDGGVYVLTGGLGGLGMALAKGLAATGRRPRLALLGRTARDLGADGAALAAAGAEVRVVACDVADPAQLARALDEVVAAFGPVNGVLHLAGVPGGGMLQFRGRADAERVLRPKVHGAVAIAECLAERPPVDFVACFSSQAALTGMVGGADYAAANAFLDAFAAGRPGWLSVDWPAWSEVGMAGDGVVVRVQEAMRAASAGDGGAPGAGFSSQTVVSAATHWALDEHRIASRAVLPGTGLVDLVLQAYLTAGRGAAPVTLRDVAFLRPLVADAPRRVRVSFTPAGAHAWRVRVQSRPDGPDEVGDRGDPDGGPAGWAEHATGTLVAGAPPARRVAVAELLTGLAGVPARPLLPSPDGDFAFGPRWRTVQRVWQSGPLTVAQLALPPPFAGEAREHPVHPALLDSGTGLARRSTPRELRVPFLYRSLTWYRHLPDRVHAVLRADPRDGLVADIDVVDEDGDVVVAIEGFRMRPARAADFGAPEPVPSHGLPPGTGVRLLLELLDSAVPGQVAVVPYWDGRPVPPAVPGQPDRPGEQPGTAAASPTAPSAAPVPPAAGSVIDRLADIWQQVLGRPRVEPADDFFEIGGDSLMAVAITGRVRDAFGVELSIGTLFDHPTLGALATVLAEEGAR